MKLKLWSIAFLFLGAHPSLAYGPGQKLWSEKMGMKLSSNLLIEQVSKNGFASRFNGGLKPGDQIVSINHQPVSNNKQFERACKYFLEKSPQPWALGVKRGGKVYELQAKHPAACNPFELTGCE